MISAITLNHHHNLSMFGNKYKVVLDSLKKNLQVIQPGQRILYQPPDNLLKSGVSWDFDWDLVEEIQMFVRGDIPNDVFVTLRFDSDESQLIVDFYRLPNGCQ